MTFEEYQKETSKTAIYPKVGEDFVYPALGLAGETGEVFEKIKKLFRDKGGKIDDEFKTSISKELGDILWYLSQLCTELGISLEEVVKMNVEKISTRYEKEMIHGSGDNREVGD